VRQPVEYSPLAYVLGSCFYTLYLDFAFNTLTPHVFLKFPQLRSGKSNYSSDRVARPFFQYYLTVRVIPNTRFITHGIFS